MSLRLTMARTPPVAASADHRASARVTGQRMRMVKPSRLSDPANIGVCVEGYVGVTDAGPGPGHLENYMRLPVEQYAVLDGANITRVGRNDFKLAVPRIEFFDIWIEPVLEVTVEFEEAADAPPKVVMRAKRCNISGSRWIEDMRINDKFEMDFRAELRWKAAAGSCGGPGKLFCKTALEVYCEALQPFAVLPRPTLEGSCNAVLSTFGPSIMRLFLEKLSQDYHRWSRDSSYRELRRLGSERSVMVDANAS